MIEQNRCYTRQKKNWTSLDKLLLVSSETLFTEKLEKFTLKCIIGPFISATI